MKSILFKIPEYYLILIAILAGYTPPIYVNPVFIGIVAILILQLIFKNRIAGLLLGSLFFLINLFFLGAVLSEFNEFTTVNLSTKQLLFVGIVIWMVNAAVSLIMVYKYAAKRLDSHPKINLEEVVD